MGENILVFPRKKLDKIGDFQGFVYNTPESRYRELLDPETLQIMDRDKAEQDPKFKQLIPYCLIVNEKNQFLVYRRGVKGGEGKLHGLMSVGWGGHMNSQDGSYEDALMRELDEELGKFKITSSKLIGFINDDSNPVGKVHFGCVHLFFVEGKMKGNEDCIEEEEFLSAEEIVKRVDEFESWSQILIRSQFQ